MRKFSLLLTLAILAMTINATPINKLQPLHKHSATELAVQSRTTIAAPHIDLQASTRAMAPQKAEGTVVTPPAGMETEKYRLNGFIYDGSSWEAVSRQIMLGWDGQNVYVQGFSVLLPEAWIMGTYDEEQGTVTFGQQYFGRNQNYDSYFFPVTPVSDTESAPISAVFNYNENARTFVLSQEMVCYIIENSSDSQLLWYYQYDSQMNMVPDGDTVEVPEDLETEEYVLTGTYMGYQDNSWFEGDPLLGGARVGYDGDDIYIQGLCSYLPQAWVKGHRQGDDYVIDNGQYFGVFIYQGEAFPLYFMGCGPNDDNVADFVLTPNAETGELVAQSWYAICDNDEVLAWYDILGNVVLTHILDEAATPADPSVLYFEYAAEEGFGYLMLDVPATDVDGNPLLTSKLGYKLFIDCGNGAEPYIFAADNYGFYEDMTVIEYNREDEMNFMKGGQLVVVYNIPDNAERIGVQSVYTGGGETNESAITWYDLTDTGVTSIAADNTRSLPLYDLMGRRVNADNLRPGLYIRQDGKKIMVIK